MPLEGPVPFPFTPVRRFDPKKSFEATSASDRMKEYLKRIPVYDAQMKALIDDFTAIRDRFKKLADEIEETAKCMEETKNA